MTSSSDGLRSFASHLFAVLANPRRLEIVYLLRSREHRVSELAAALGLAQAATSQHLAVLRSSGVVEARRDANFVYYRLAVPSLVPAIDALLRAASDLIRSQEDQLRPLLHAMRASRIPGVNA
jgi:ArsR family transcriptional regulator